MVFGAFLSLDFVMETASRRRGEILSSPDNFEASAAF